MRIGFRAARTVHAYWSLLGKAGVIALSCEVLPRVGGVGRVSFGSEFSESIKPIEWRWGVSMSSVRVGEPGPIGGDPEEHSGPGWLSVDGDQGRLDEQRELRTAGLACASDRPFGESADVVLYDGECRFCVRQIENLRRLDVGGRLRFISLHDLRVATAYPDLTKQQLMEEMWIVTSDGSRWGGAYAIRYLTKRLPLLWPMYPWMRIPFSMPLWSWLYRQIAKRRYRIAGRDCSDGSCSLHG